MSAGLKVDGKAAWWCAERYWGGDTVMEQKTKCLGGVGRWIWGWTAFENKDKCVMIVLW